MDKDQIKHMVDRFLHPFQTCYPVPAVNPLAAECETLRADLARANERNELTHKAYVDENNRIMEEREALRAELATYKADDMPWDRVELRRWSIVGMNHYHVGGARQLFVAMTNADGRCITAEGSHERQVWKDLAGKAYRVPD